MIDRQGDFNGSTKEEHGIQSLAGIRDRTAPSSRNTSKGALVKETLAVFQAVSNGLPLAEVRSAILDAQVIEKTSYQTRRKIWNAISHRYLAVCPEWIAGSLAHTCESVSQYTDFLSLTYLYYVLRDHLTFAFVTGPLWFKWQQQSINIERGDFLNFLDEQSQDNPIIKKWHEVTRQRLGSNTLTALRDFGILKGTQKKQIQRPMVSDETVYHLLCLLMAEGKMGMDLLQAPDWHIFLFNEADVIMALSKLDERQWIKFEKSGRTVMLALMRLPEVKA